jgi:Protein of unknown function (DUF3048) N-terminal domain/Protein of unknown function (DUF3048) C-terminal domain
MLASPTQFGIGGRFCRWTLVVFSLLVLSGGCSSPSTTPQVDENLLLTPDMNRPTATPFQPGDSTDESPYYVPYVSPTPAPTSTLKPSIITPGTPLVEVNLMPTPFPSGYQGMPVFVLSTSTNPLTGLTATDPALLERRPIAVKVTLFPRYVRPESGLTLADVVYEYYIEAGLTRFIAIFYSNNADMVGPVRSGRFFDEHIARMYQAFFVFKYADPRVYDYYKDSDLKDYLVVPGAGACPPFVIGPSERDTYNNIFFNTVKFKDCIAKHKTVDNNRPPVRSGFFGSQPLKSDLTADRIYTEYSSDDYHYWQYLPGEGRYQRYQEVNSLRKGVTEAYAPLTDALTGLPVKADNVVMLFVQHRFANKFDEEDEVYHIDMYGSGDAYVFRDGVAVKATWNRVQLDQPILLTSTLGAPIYLKPGVTFYEVVGDTSESWIEGADWHFLWHNP